MKSETRMPAGWVVVGVLYAALLLRLVGLGYGAPAAWLHSADEHDSAVRAIQMGRGDLLPIHASKPTLYPAVVAAAYGGWYGYLVARRGETAADFERRFFRSPFEFCFLARSVSVLASMATLGVLACAFRRRSAGEMAWVLLLPAFGGCSVYYAHVAKEDALGALFVLGSLACTARALREGTVRTKWFALAFLSSGLAVATKYNCFFAVLFPAMALATGGQRPDVRMLLLFLASCLCGFLLGVPYALLHPVDFLGRTFGSAIFTQVVGGWNILLYDDHRGLGFLWTVFFREFSVVIFPLVATLGVLVATSWRKWLWALVPTGIYILVLSASRQLDYQYAVPLTPVVAWLGAEGLAAVRARLTRTGARLAATGMVLCGAALLAPAIRGASEYGSDTRTEAAVWLVREGKAHQITPAKPLLVVSGYMGFYYPPLGFGAPTFRRLAEEARAAGGAGGYFDRAALNAPPDARWNAHFLELKTGFRSMPDGSRKFDVQPFSLNIEDYRGKYSAVIIPGWTDRIVARRAPELAGFNKLVDEFRSGEELAVFDQVPGDRAGPKITIYAPP